MGNRAIARVLGIAAAAIRWWASLIIVAVATLFSIAMFLEIRDPFVGPAIRREAGAGYVLQVYTAAVAAVGIPLLATAVAKRRSTARY